MARVAEPVYLGSRGVCGAVEMGVGVAERLPEPTMGPSVERKRPVAKRREYPGGDAVAIVAYVQISQQITRYVLRYLDRKSVV